MKNSIAVALAAGVSVANAAGSFAVVNHCPFDLYLWSEAGGHAPSEMITLPGNKASIGYKEPYRYIDQWNGVSVKIAPYYVNDGDIPGGGIPITQLEYTVPPRDVPVPDNQIYYDLSFVDGHALAGVPLTMQTSDPHDQCPSGTCGSDKNCTAGYLWSTDDSKTHACSLDTDIIWTICDGSAAPNLIYKTGKVNFSNYMLAKREVELEATKREAEPQPEAEPMAVCIPVAGGPVGLCDEPVPVAKPTTSTSSTIPATSTPTPTPTSVVAPVVPKPIVALQQSAGPESSSTQSAPAPAATAPVTVPVPLVSAPNSKGGVVAGLKNLLQTPVTTWLQPKFMPGTINFKRGLDVEIPEKRETHLHNHQAFHNRRNRIVKRQ